MGIIAEARKALKYKAFADFDAIKIAFWREFDATYFQRKQEMLWRNQSSEHFHYREAARQFEINDHKCVAAWERIYLTEGPEGFAIERRGRGSKGRPPKQLPKEVEEDLLTEVQRLRAENAYLKNLQALVLENERRRLKKHRWSKCWGKNFHWRSC